MRNLIICIVLTYKGKFMHAQALVFHFERKMFEEDGDSSWPRSIYKDRNIGTRNFVCCVIYC
jgi:hypothetical protein